MWDLTGMRVKGMYLGTIGIEGKVELSRVAYGGDVKHTIVLDTPIEVYGSTRDRVIVEHGRITQVVTH